jgi:hypothetical protein
MDGARARAGAHRAAPKGPALTGSRGALIRRALGACIASLALVLPRASSANGRFPRAERLLEDTKDSRHLVLAATYGLLVTRDRGQSWFHVCEAAFADTGERTDPVAALAGDGGLVTSVYSNLSRSSESACDFEQKLGGHPTQAVADFTIDADGAVIAVLITSANGTTTSQLQESLDNGRHFHALGPVLPDSVRLVATVDVAPSDPQRIYVSGLGLNGAGVLLRSDDRGASFTTLPLSTDAKSDEVPFIAAVDANDPDALYVRTDVWRYDELAGVASADDALWYSDDGGASFSELIRRGGKLFGFALSPDGEEVLVGYGDPVEGGGRIVDPDALGIYRAAAGTSGFEKVLTSAVSCLSWTEIGIYACTSQAELGFALGLADPANLKMEETAPFESLLSLMDVKGPLSCPTCASGARCGAFWEATCAGWGRADCAAPTEATGGAAECSAGAGAGGALDAAGGSSGAASTGPAAGRAGAAATSEGGVPPTMVSLRSNDADGSGCGCRAAGSLRAPGGAFVVLLVGLLRPSRRRRRLALLLAALTLVGCADKTDSNADPSPTTDDGSECTGDFDTFEPGMTRLAQPGELTVELIDADPAPPVVRSDNTWWLRLTDSDGQLLTGAEVVASPYMPKHQHGSAEVVVEEQTEGEYQLSPIELIMPGVWEIPLSITPADGATSETSFRFCIAER